MIHKITLAGVVAVLGLATSGIASAQTLNVSGSTLQ